MTTTPIDYRQPIHTNNYFEVLEPDSPLTYSKETLIELRKKVPATDQKMIEMLQEIGFPTKGAAQKRFKATFNLPREANRVSENRPKPSRHSSSAKPRMVWVLKSRPN